MLKDIEELDNNHVQDLYKRIGLNVKRIREERGLSQLALAQAIGHKSVTMVSCCEICYKNYHFNIEHLSKIAFVLDTDIKEFFN
jgi:DNA-binding XRE family transcriptional regulator